jgi:hypothetical protein
MRKIPADLALILALLLAVAAGTQSAFANPYLNFGEVSPRSDTIPPQISFNSPKNTSIYYGDSVNLTLTVTGPTGPTVYNPYLEAIYYETDWQNRIRIYQLAPSASYYLHTDEYSVNLNLTKIQEGQHTITVFTRYRGSYIPAINNSHPLSLNKFSINASSIVYFTVDDRIEPTILAISVANKVFNQTDVPLTFRGNELFSHITYSLDGKTNVSTVGDTTLNGLSYGTHILTAFPIDKAGNRGILKTVNFTVIDVVPPKVSILSIEKDKRYDSSNLVLNFTINEEYSKTTYVLDNQHNVSTVGNLTLTGLSNGEHNVTVYSTDYAGNVGASETINFTVAVPFSILPIVAVFTVALVVVAGLLVYHKKHNKDLVKKV